jgi:hypothetical protein
MLSVAGAASDGSIEGDERLKTRDKRKILAS